MASEEHLKISSEIKELHKNLRIKSKELGAEEAWKQHLKDHASLQKYAENMKNLSENFWKVNLADKSGECRISWTVEFCKNYFQRTTLEGYRKKEIEILEKINKECGLMKNLESEQEISEIPEKLKLLDVGSSFNPFKNFDIFEVTPIDIAPADNSVLYCDFLEVPIIDKEIVKSQTSIASLPENYFNVIIFSLLLEYLPSSDQRIKCCEKAYQLLRKEGILVILTPDSKHSGANAKLMKNWRYALSLIGFQRINITKLKNLTCLVFRKTMKEVSNRWAKKYKEDYMTFSLNIPQDSNIEIEEQIEEDKNKANQTVIENIDFNELPGFLE